MGVLNAYINSKFKEIALKLPNLVHSEPASFSCGFNTGYKQAMLDLHRFLEEIAEDFEEDMPDLIYTQEFEEL